jgi:pimeloyl-ACP methyl ester carboxylesterase
MSRSAIVSRIAHVEPGRAPDLRGDGFWWDELRPDFAKTEERFELGLVDRLRVGAVSRTDVVLRTLGASAVGALALPVGYHPLELLRSLDDLSLYAPLAESGDATRFFARPPRHVPIEKRRARMPLFRPSDGVCEDLRFESPFVPLNARIRNRYLSRRPNRFAHARHWRHDGKARPTVIAIHGFSADLYHLNEWFFAIPWLYREGYDVLLATLPFHGSRQSKLSPFSGHGFFAHGPSHINECFGQGIFDLRIFVDHLMDELGVPKVGVTGVSLGGHTTALLACVEPRLSMAIPNVPVTSIADLVMEWTPIGEVIRAALAIAGRSVVDARRLLAVSCPLTYRPLLDRERLFIIGGVGDRLAPPKHSRLLWDHWDRCHMHWFPGSHLLHLDRGEYFRHMRRFMSSIGFSIG